MQSANVLLLLLFLLVGARILIYLWQHEEGGGQLRGDWDGRLIVPAVDPSVPTPRIDRAPPSPPPTPVDLIVGDYDFERATLNEVLLPTAHRRAERIAKHCKAAQLDLLRPSERKPRNGFEFGRWWQDNWEPTWACPLEERIQKRDPLSNEPPATSLADGGKWVCDPMDTLANRRSPSRCLVYRCGSE